jgi:LCP family protein required for cell wall assembly
MLNSQFTGLWRGVNVVILGAAMWLVTPAMALAAGPEPAGVICPAAADDWTASNADVLSTTVFNAVANVAGSLLPDSAPAERVNILLLGADTRPDDTYGHTDTIIVATIDPATKTAGMLSIPRDLWVDIPGYGQNRINQAFRLGQIKAHPGGGPALLKETIGANLGIAIDYYVQIDFAGFEQVVDTLGGIEVCVPHTIDAAAYYGYTAQDVNPAEYYSFVPVQPAAGEEAAAELTPAAQKGYEFLYIEAGLHTLDGATALRYARTRASVTADFARVQRQQAVLLAMRHKALQLGLLAKAPQLWQTMRHTIETDLQPADILPLVRLAMQIPRANIHTALISHAHTTDYKTDTGARVLLPNYAQINPVVAEMFGNMVDMPAAARVEPAAQAMVWRQ